jgi:hypothetical protein
MYCLKYKTSECLGELECPGKETENCPLDKAFKRRNKVRDKIKIEVVLNKSYGGYDLSAKAIRRLMELEALPHIEPSPNESAENYTYRQVLALSRFDPKLIQVVKELGKEAGSGSSKLEVEEITLWFGDLVQAFDGKESLR